MKESLIATAGELGVIYIADTTDLTQRKLYGHFKAVTCVKFINQKDSLYDRLLLTGSDDFSVRIWHTDVQYENSKEGIQLVMFLDLDQYNSAILCLDWK